MKKKIIITGGYGVLGRYVSKVFIDSTLFIPTRRELDITNKALLKEYFAKKKPHIVIHLAANTDVDECERYPQLAMETNAQGTKNIAELCKKHKCKLIYMSTAAIFPGNKKKFFEDDIPRPVNTYGKSKLLGEAYVVKNVKDHLIIRVAWLIGGGNMEKKFISFIVAKSTIEKEIFVVSDTQGTLAYAREVAEFIKRLVDENKKGVFHYGSTGSCTRVAIARTIIKLLNRNVKITPVKSNYFKKSFFAPRPLTEALSSKKTKFPFTWQQSLERYITSELI